jgi:hypothetical protein
MKKFNVYNRIKARSRKFLKDYFVSDKRFIIDNFEKRLGYKPDLENPRTFNEKINWRKLYDRRDIFVTFADRIKVRKYVEERIGKEPLIKILQIVDSPKKIDYPSLPKSFIIKANHGSGWLKIVYNKDKIITEEINDYFLKILRTDYYSVGREWCYRGIPRCLIIEELLLDENGNLPYDYKFFCFDGEVRFLAIDFDRFKNHRRNIYDAQFRKIDLEYIYSNYKKRVEIPGNFSQLKRIASILSKGIDFIRVDLYSINNKIYFGELTNYPGNGFITFNPKKFDTIFGEYWKIKRN